MKNVLLAKASQALSGRVQNNQNNNMHIQSGTFSKYTNTATLFGVICELFWVDILFLKF